MTCLTVCDCYNPQRPLLDLNYLEPIVPAVRPAVPEVKTAPTPETKSEEPKPPVAPSKANPRDVQEIINASFLNTADYASWSTTHKSKQPVPHSVFNDFLKGDFLKELVEGLNNEEWFSVKTDASTLEQTPDLKQSIQVSCFWCLTNGNKIVIKDFYQAVTGTHFRQLLTSLTGLNISAVSDVTGEIYKEG